MMLSMNQTVDHDDRCFCGQHWFRRGVTTRYSMFVIDSRIVLCDLLVRACRQAPSFRFPSSQGTAEGLSISKHCNVLHWNEMV
jgi:hypothetical protein